MLPNCDAPRPGAHSGERFCSRQLERPCSPTASFRALDLLTTATTDFTKRTSCSPRANGEPFEPALEEKIERALTNTDVDHATRRHDAHFFDDDAADFEFDRALQTTSAQRWLRLVASNARLQVCRGAATEVCVVVRAKACVSSMTERRAAVAQSREFPPGVIRHARRWFEDSSYLSSTAAHTHATAATATPTRCSFELAAPVEHSPPTPHLHYTARTSGATTRSNARTTPTIDGESSSSSRAFRVNSRGATGARCTSRALPPQRFDRRLRAPACPPARRSILFLKRLFIIRDQFSEGAHDYESIFPHARAAPELHEQQTSRRDAREEEAGMELFTFARAAMAQNRAGFRPSRRARVCARVRTKPGRGRAGFFIFSPAPRGAGTSSCARSRRSGRAFEGTEARRAIC